MAFNSESIQLFFEYLSVVTWRTKGKKWINIFLLKPRSKAAIVKEQHGNLAMNFHGKQQSDCEPRNGHISHFSSYTKESC